MPIPVRFSMPSIPDISRTGFPEMSCDAVGHLSRYIQDPEIPLTTTVVALFRIRTRFPYASTILTEITGRNGSVFFPSRPSLRLVIRETMSDAMLDP